MGLIDNVQRNFPAELSFIQFTNQSIQVQAIPSQKTYSHENWMKSRWKMFRSRIKAKHVHVCSTKFLEVRIFPELSQFQTPDFLQWNLSSTAPGSDAAELVRQTPRTTRFLWFVWALPIEVNRVASDQRRVVSLAIGDETKGYRSREDD